MPALLNKPLIGPPWLTAHSHALSTREGMFSKSVASKGRNQRTRAAALCNRGEGGQISS